ncbi:MAG TPA: FAD:protein FMN transferase [Actinocrinis sp.]|nr:FAD:protein FMN transferase [Actinocrinis sp.]
MGTVISIAARMELDRDPDPAAASSSAAGTDTFALATDAAFACLRDADRIFSTYRPDSPISRIRDGRLSPDRLPDHPDGEAIRTVLALSAQLKRESDGAFDIWSVAAQTPGSAESPDLPDLAEPGFDPSGLVKGWAAERASRRLAESGVPSHSLGAGGDIQVRGGRLIPRAEPRPWRIGVSDPHRAGRLLTVVELDDGAVATSGTAERGAHIWDPRRRAPATALASVTIVGPELTWADGYATAAQALGGSDVAQLGTVYAWLHDLAARTGYQAFTVTRDTEVWWTPGFLEHAPELRELLNR